MLFFSYTFIRSGSIVATPYIDVDLGASPSWAKVYLFALAHLGPSWGEQQAPDIF